MIWKPSVESETDVIASDARTTVRWGFRPAASPAVGGGHLFRSLALAAAFPISPWFFVEDADRWRATLNAYGFKSIAEESEFGTRALEEALVSGEIAGVVFDGYGFDPVDVRNIASHAFVVEFRDMVFPAHGHAVLAPSLVGDRTANCTSDDDLVFSNVALLRGPAFVPLGPDYEAARMRMMGTPVRGSVSHILVSMGLRDSKNATDLALSAIASLDIDGSVSVVLGGNAPHLSQVRARVAEDPRISLWVDRETMIPLYLSADICIGAGGVSMLERLCCGLPSIVVTLADNQQSNAQIAAEAGCVVHAGAVDALELSVLAQCMEDLMANSQKRTDMRTNGQLLIDGGGARRAAAALQDLRLAHLASRIPLG